MKNKEWKKYLLGDIIQFKRGFDLPKTKMNKGPYPVIGSNGIIGYHNEYKVKDICLTVGRSGNIGKPLLIKTDAWPHNTSLFVEKFKNIKLEYGYYLLQTLKLENFGGGSAVPTLNRNHLSHIPIRVPDLNIQEKIVSLLETIESKISINNNINQKLEETAKAIYKEWFVNFNFPDENGLPYKDNGGEFYETELGEIPVGWEVTELKNISEIQTGYAFKSKDYKDDGIKVIRTLNILENGFIDNNNLVYLPKDFYNNSKYEKQKLFLYDTLLVMVGATIGKIGLITQRNLPALQNQNLWRFRPINNVVGNLYLYHVIRQCASNAMGWATGSARQFFQKSQFEKINIILPENEVLMKFEQICSSFYNYISNNLMENEYLNNCKTLLLNKLMSGQIDVDKLNIDWDKLDKTLKEVE